MNENSRNIVLAMVMCVLFYMGYSKYMQNKYPHMAKKSKTAEQIKAEGEQAEVASSTNENPAGAAVAANSQSPSSEAVENTPQVESKLEATQLVIETAESSYKLSQSDSSLQSVKLKDFKESKEENSESVDLIERRLRFFGMLQTEENPRGFNGSRNGEDLVFYRKQSDWNISQTFRVKKDFLSEFQFEFKNLTGKPSPLKASVVFEEVMKPAKAAGGLFPSAASGLEGWQFLHFKVDGDFDDETLTSYCTDEFFNKEFVNAKIDFLGLNNRYFLKAIMPLDPKSTVVVSTKKIGADCAVRYQFNFNAGDVGAGESVKLSYQGFMGPKSAEYLSKANVDLRDNIQFGIFSFIAHPVLSFLKWIYSIVQNWGIAVIILTVCLKILFFPLTKAAAVSAIQMKKIQPEMKKMQAKYKDDRQKMQAEMMGLYKQHGVNPAKSCLPVLPQIPVFIAFYNVLMYSLELRHAPFMGWLQDLSNYDPYYILPVLLGLLMVLQMKLTPNAAMDKTQQKVMMVMPLMFTFFMISLPSGLVVYMVVNSMLSIAQQQWLNKRYSVKPAVSAST